MTPEQAFLAVNLFLRTLWERARQPGELGLFLSMTGCVPGGGSLDPAMWFDWLAWVRKIQTGELVPESTNRGFLTARMMKPMDAEQAYLAMFSFIEEYWERVGRPSELGDLLDQMRHTPGGGTAVPEMWKRWLAAIEKVPVNS